MAKTSMPAHISYATTFFSAVFLCLLFVLHFLKPEFDPSWRMISEYAIGHLGWLMVLAFFCWGASVLSLVVALWTAFRGGSGVVARGWLILIAAALVGAGIFKTNPITDPAPTLAHRIHQICGTIVIFTFPIAVTMATKSLRQNEAWGAFHGHLRRIRWLPWLGLLTFFSALIVFRLLHLHEPRIGPHVLIGWPNRLMVLSYHIWLQILAVQVRRT